MTKQINPLALTWLLSLCLLVVIQCQHGSRLGLYEAQSEVGVPRLSGSVEFDEKTNSYRVSGAGENMWGAKDAFHFLWRKSSGDQFLQARISWPHAGGHEHRKAGLLLRNSLAPDAAYVDLVQHGDGLVSMQFRRHTGGLTEEIRAPQGLKGTLRLERHGAVFSSHLLDDSGVLHPIGSFSFELDDTLLVGLAVCSHDDRRRETALFEEVSLQSPERDDQRLVESTLEIVNIFSGQRRVVHRVNRLLEAPNWFGDHLVVNSQGKLNQIPVSGGDWQVLDTGFADRCNNDHGFSADGKWLAISHSPKDHSLIYVLPSHGGIPRLVTTKGPSYWHGWSPDGGTLTYCAQREGEYDVYTIPFSGGQEQRLTTAPGLDDGPEYSPDGQYIYFNSVRKGVMKIWRMKPDGSQQEQVTNNEEYADWFAHPSPDGKWLVFLSYDKGVQGHPPNQNVCLRLMPTAGGEPMVIAQFFGGQGSLNVPSWSADSRELAFVSYR